MSKGAPCNARCAVVVVNYGSHGLVAGNLAELRGGSDGLVDVIVVDNFTTIAERVAIAALCADRGWRLIANDRNIGFGAAVNIALRAAWNTAADTVAIVNPDCALPAADLARLTEASRRRPLALISPALADAGGKVVFNGSRVSLRTGEIRGVTSARPFSRWSGADAVAEWLPGTCLVTSRQVFERTGGFDESYFLYWEDVDLSARCVAAGGELVVLADVVVRHDAGATQGPQRGRAKSALYYRYNCRNRLLFAARHVPPGGRLRWAVTTPMVSREVLLRGGRSQLLRSWRPWLAVVRGSLAGLGLLVIGSRRWPAERVIPRFEASVSKRAA